MLRALLAILGLCFAGGAVADDPFAIAQAQNEPAKQQATKAASKPAANKAAKAPVRPTWAELPAEQQQVLSPLKDDWENLERERRLKWIGIAKRYPKMNAEEQ